MQRIVITGKGSVSAAGYRHDDLRKSYFSNESFIQYRNFSMGLLPVASLQNNAENELDTLRKSSQSYKNIDRSALLAILASRMAVSQASWQDISAGVNIGSSRGATETYESKLEKFIEEGKSKTSSHTSPVTTLGNISSWVMQDINLQGPLISHSMTCSTGLQAVANGVAWIKAGMADKFLVGAAEASLTDFTLAQMKALRIYSIDDSIYPCRPFAMEEVAHNRMVIGEGAAVFALEKYKPGENREILAEILSIGFGSEKLTSQASISEGGDALYNSMAMAIKNLPQQRQVDLILCHAPGTINGDQAELTAISKLFQESVPDLFSNKWKIGHTLGASGTLSLDLALHILQSQEQVNLPYPGRVKNKNKSVNTIMINATGFGGNAVSVIVGKIN